MKLKYVRKNLLIACLPVALLMAFASDSHAQAYVDPKTGEMRVAKAGDVIQKEWNGQPDFWRWNGEIWEDIPEGIPTLSEEELGLIEQRLAELEGLQGEKLAWESERRTREAERAILASQIKALEEIEARLRQIIADQDRARELDLRRIELYEKIERRPSKLEIILKSFDWGFRVADIVTR